MEVIFIAIGVLVGSFALIFAIQGLSKGNNVSEYQARDTKELYDGK